MTVNSNYVTLPELIAYALDHDCDIDAAFNHFRDIGRIASVPPPKPIPDGWQPPSVTFRFTAPAKDRAQRLHTLATVQAAARLEFETLMLGKARRTQKPVHALDIVFSSFAMPGGTHEDGYTILPIDDHTIQIEPTEFTPIDAIEDKSMLMPIKDEA